MNTENKKNIQGHMPSTEEVVRELGKATSIDEFLRQSWYLCEVVLKIN